MIDFDMLLGADNPLSRMLSEAALNFKSSLQSDAHELANTACIGERGTTLRGSLKTFNYDGKAFILVFEANLPEDHEHYWLAEMFIDDFDSESYRERKIQEEMEKLRV